MLVVQIVVPPVVLLVSFVKVLFEVAGLVLLTGCLVVAPESPLAILKSFFLESCCFHVAIFQSALVLPPSRVSWRHHIMQSFREVVHLNVEF